MIVLSLFLGAGCGGLFGGPDEQAADAISQTNEAVSEHNRLFRRRFALERMALHAQQIELPHPLNGERVTVTAPLPNDLRQSLAALARDAATPAAPPEPFA